MSSDNQGTVFTSQTSHRDKTAYSNANIKCFKCGRYGHIQKYCRSQNNQAPSRDEEKSKVTQGQDWNRSNPGRGRGSFFGRGYNNGFRGRRMRTQRFAGNSTSENQDAANSFQATVMNATT
ncbi:hypothetical protein QE152_g17059 [Popillia japonica]|uniref:CCHC-type domain-containing protein n=1 Tax=Popillia japonica TaxID=7064 RepID=A0AAW1L5F5_POPJA